MHGSELQALPCSAGVRFPGLIRSLGALRVSADMKKFLVPGCGMDGRTRRGTGNASVSRRSPSWLHRRGTVHAALAGLVSESAWKRRRKPPIRERISMQTQTINFH